MGPAKWFLVFAKNVVIDAIECVAHIQINNIAVSLKYSVHRDDKRSFSRVPLFSALFHRHSFVCF